MSREAAGSGTVPAGRCWDTVAMGRPERADDDVASRYATGADASALATVEGLRRAENASSVVLVEGISDQIALETLAARLGLDLEACGVVVLPINGAQAAPGIVRRLTEVGPQPRLSGLSDVAEERFFRRGIAAAGIGSPRSSPEMERLGFFVCHRDLEDELIRAAGEDTMTSLLDAHGDLPSFRTLQKQRVWAGRPFDEQAHRWLRAGATRNLRYARLLVDAIDADLLPAPLIGVLDAACR